MARETKRLQWKGWEGYRERGMIRGIKKEEKGKEREGGGVQTRDWNKK